MVSVPQKIGKVNQNIAKKSEYNIHESISQPKDSQKSEYNEKYCNIHTIMVSVHSTNKIDIFYLA